MGNALVAELTNTSEVTKAAARAVAAWRIEMDIW